MCHVPGAQTRDLAAWVYRRHSAITTNRRPDVKGVIPILGVGTELKLFARRPNHDWRFTQDRMSSHAHPGCPELHPFARRSGRSGATGGGRVWRRVVTGSKKAPKPAERARRGRTC